ncbi:hypothetical protein ACOME3_006937 [Neoechinorhynchus agilis]
MMQEAGVHRVQRVPETESGGRIHTSTVSVSVLPIHNKPVELNIEDIRVETMSSRGPGGQHANKTQSAVRITHEPTGWTFSHYVLIVVFLGIAIVRDTTRFQNLNKHEAMDALRKTLQNRAKDATVEMQSQLRSTQIGNSDRSDRIRTYNFVQDRVTDHRIRLTLNGVKAFLNGSDKLDATIEQLLFYDMETKLC